MRQRLEAATAAVIDVLERYDLTVTEVDELVRSITNRLFTLSGTVRVRDFKGYQIDAHGEVIKPADREKTTGSDVADQNRLEKSYTCTLPHGGCVKIDISATAESVGEDMFPALSEIGIASRDFYLEFGQEINRGGTEQEASE